MGLTYNALQIAQLAKIKMSNPAPKASRYNMKGKNPIRPTHFMNSAIQA